MNFHNNDQEQKEIHTWCGYEHPHIVKSFKFFIEQDHFDILIEFIERPK
jgi:hypothetical protein